MDLGLGHYFKKKNTINGIQLFRRKLKEMMKQLCFNIVVKIINGIQLLRGKLMEYCITMQTLEL